MREIKNVNTKILILGTVHLKRICKLLPRKKWNQFQSQNITQNTNKMNKVINMAIVLDKNT